MLKPKVLFLCGANACRTQMAGGFLRDLAGDRFEVLSAGYEPAAEVCSDAVQAMREVGIDITGQQPKATVEFLGQRINYVIRCASARRSAIARSSPAWSGVTHGRSKIRRPLNRHRREKRPCAGYAMKSTPRGRVCQ